MIFILPSFDKFFLFAALFLMAANGYYAYVSVRAFKLSGLSLEKTVVAKCTNMLTVREVYADHSKIGEIKILRTPADIKLGTCKITLTVRSESSDSAKVRNIPYDETARKISGLYGIKI